MSAKITNTPGETILTAAEVHAHYRLGRTAGYQLTQRLAPLQCAPGRWRLADLEALDAARAQKALAELLKDGDPLAELSPEPTPSLPAPRKGGRRAAIPSAIPVAA